MNLLEEIELGSSDDTMPLATLLRKCLVLASRLDIQPAKNWINWELDGYPHEEEVPTYRLVHLVIKANMHDITKQIAGWTVPSVCLGERAKDYTELKYRNGVGEIEHLLGKANSTIIYEQSNLPIFLKSRKFTRMEITSAWGGGTSASNLKKFWMP